MLISLETGTESAPKPESSIDNQETGTCGSPHQRVELTCNFEKVLIFFYRIKIDFQMLLMFLQVNYKRRKHVCQDQVQCEEQKALGK